MNLQVYTRSYIGLTYTSRVILLSYTNPFITMFPSGVWREEGASDLEDIQSGVIHDISTYELAAGFFFDYPKFLTHTKIVTFQSHRFMILLIFLNKMR